jgi:hypothetical protein
MIIELQSLPGEVVRRGFRLSLAQSDSQASWLTQRGLDLLFRCDAMFFRHGNSKRCRSLADVLLFRELDHFCGRFRFHLCCRNILWCMNWHRLARYQ